MPYTIAFRKNAAGPIVANAIGPIATPAPSPSNVAPSKRADILPRSSSSVAVAIAMNPRIDGTLAAVDAPSSSLSAQHEQVRGEARQDHRDRTEGRSEQHHPVMPEAVGQDPEDRGEDELRHEEHRREDADGVGSTSGPPWRGRRAR